MQNEQSAIALLLFRIGPVLCCAPADPVQSIIAPPKLTHPPGSTDAKPGIFYHSNHIISVNELRHRCGVTVAEREQPGRLIITLQGEAFIAYWVDEIIEVIDTPAEGWSAPPSHLPKGVFSKTLLLNEKIYLFADFANFENLPESDYLSQYIDRLAGKLPADESGDAANELHAAPKTASSTAKDTNTAPDKISPTATATRSSALPADRSSETALAADSEDSSDIPRIASPPLAEPQAEPEIPPADQAAIRPASTLVEAQVMNANPPPSPELATPTTDHPLPTTSSAANPGQEDEVLPPAANKPTTSRDDANDTTETESAVEVSADTGIEQEQSSAEKSGGIKTAYLKPVPAVVPEAEREPQRPPFPWQNLAAAVVLFITLAGIGIYYFWSSSNRPVAVSAYQKPTLVEPAHTALVQEKVTHAEEAEVPEKTNTAREAEHSRKTESNPQQTTEAVKPDKNTYHAEINPDDKGVTIVLHSPENEPVLKSSELKPTPELSRKTVRPGKFASQKKTAKPHKEEIIHIVVKGDTLWAIAEHYVKDPYKYPTLAKFSKISNPDRIYPGNRVRILRHIKDDD